MRWVASLVLILLVLLAVPLIYLWLFPPFRQPETGHLEAALTRDVEVRAGRATLVRLAVNHDPRIFDASTVDFPSTVVDAGVTVLEGSPGPVRLRILTADPASSVEVMESGTDELRWVIPCDHRGPGSSRDDSCRRGYFAVITAPELAGQARVRLGLRAELAFPPHVPTPLLVGIGLDASEVSGQDAALILHTAADEGTFTISAERPVAWTPVTVSGEDGAPPAPGEAEGAAGMLVRVDVTRQGEATPTGLDAPPPVRLAVLDDAGLVLADLSLRPTRPGLIALPALHCESLPCDEDYHLVAQWRDRAAQSYDIGWSVEAAVVTSSTEAGVRVAGGRTEYPDPLATGGGGGTVELGTSDQRQFELGLQVDPGLGGGEGHLSPTAGVLHLDLEIRTGEETMVLYLDANADGSGDGLPVVLEPGVRRSAVVDALAGCDRSCFRWTARPALETAPDGSPVDVSLTIDWRADVTLWPLDPFASPDPTVMGE